jgi:hypothetical protein
MDESFSSQFYAFAVKQYFIMQHKLLLVWGKMVDRTHQTPKGFEILKRRLLDYDGQGSMHKAGLPKGLRGRLWACPNICKYEHFQIFANIGTSKKREIEAASWINDHLNDLWVKSELSGQFDDARMISMFFKSDEIIRLQSLQGQSGR